MTVEGTLAKLAGGVQPWHADALANEDLPTNPLGMLFTVASPDVITRLCAVVEAARQLLKDADSEWAYDDLYRRDRKDVRDALAALDSTSDQHKSERSESGR